MSRRRRQVSDSDEEDEQDDSNDEDSDDEIIASVRDGVLYLKSDDAIDENDSLSSPITSEAKPSQIAVSPINAEDNTAKKDVSGKKLRIKKDPTFVPKGKFYLHDHRNSVTSRKILKPRADPVLKRQELYEEARPPTTVSFRSIPPKDRLSRGSGMDKDRDGDVGGGDVWKHDKFEELLFYEEIKSSVAVKPVLDSHVYRNADTIPKGNPRTRSKKAGHIDNNNNKPSMANDKIDNRSQSHTSRTVGSQGGTSPEVRPETDNDRTSSRVRDGYSKAGKRGSHSHKRATGESTGDQTALSSSLEGETNVKAINAESPSQNDNPDQNPSFNLKKQGEPVRQGYASVTEPSHRYDPHHRVKGPPATTESGDYRKKNTVPFAASSQTRNSKVQPRNLIQEKPIQSTFKGHEINAPPFVPTMISAMASVNHSRSMPPKEGPILKASAKEFTPPSAKADVDHNLLMPKDPLSAPVAGVGEVGGEAYPHTASSDGVVWDKNRWIPAESISVSSTDGQYAMVETSIPYDSGNGHMMQMGVGGLSQQPLSSYPLQSSFGIYDSTGSILYGTSQSGGVTTVDGLTWYPDPNVAKTSQTSQGIPRNTPSYYTTVQPIIPTTVDNLSAIPAASYQVVTSQNGTTYFIPPVAPVPVVPVSTPVITNTHSL